MANTRAEFVFLTSKVFNLEDVRDKTGQDERNVVGKIRTERPTSEDHTIAMQDGA